MDGGATALMTPNRNKKQEIIFYLVSISLIAVFRYSEDSFSHIQKIIIGVQTATKTFAIFCGKRLSIKFFFYGLLFKEEKVNVIHVFIF